MMPSLQKPGWNFLINCKIVTGKTSYTTGFLQQQ